MQTPCPAWFVRHWLYGFLDEFKLLQQRPFVIRLRDGKGRLVWTSGWNRAGERWVHVLRRLVDEPLPPGQVLR